MDLKRFVAPFSPPTTTLIDSLRYWTEQQPQEVTYHYTDGEGEETSLTYEQFDRHARAIAARLVDLAIADAIQNEWVTHLEDLVERRLILHFSPHLTRTTLEHLAQALVQNGKLSPDELGSSINRCATRLQSHFGLHLK